MPVRLLTFIEKSSMALFFLQGFRVIFSVTFGIIYDQVFEGPMNLWLVGSVVLVAAGLLAPILTPHRGSRARVALLVIVAALARIPLSVNDASIRYWAALFVVAFSGLYLVEGLKGSRKSIFSALITALILDQFLRAVGNTYDLSLRVGWLPVQMFWSLILAGASLRIRRLGEGETGAGMSWKGGLALGSFLFLETSLLSLPNGIAHWSGVPYAFIVSILMGITFIPLVPGFHNFVLQLFNFQRIRIGLGFLLGAALIAGYFGVGTLSVIALLGAHALALGSLAYLLTSDHSDRGRPGFWVGVGFLLLMVLNFLNAFAFTYPYTLPIMRGLGWVVYLLAGAGLALSLAAASDPGPSFTDRDRGLMPVLLSGGLALSLTVIAVWPQPANEISASGGVRLATYNIHYGYDDDWHFNLEAQAKAIEAAGVDVIALQEVDVGRITSYSADDAYYLGRRLGMNIAYLPTVEHLTGIAVLYKGSHRKVDQVLLSSLQEQTGLVLVEVQYQNRSFDFYGVWLGLGNEDTDQQIAEALGFIGARDQVGFGGDFNAEPNSPVVAAIKAAGFEDPFALLGIDPAPPTSPAIAPQSRIDYVWVRGLEPSRAWVSSSLASDHRMVVVEVGLD